jgi:hypothetical protein
LKDIETSKDPALGASQAIIRRIRTRRLYKLVDIILVPKAEEMKMKTVCTIARCGVVYHLFF